MTPDARKLCDSVSEWIEQSLRQGEFFGVFFEIDESLGRCDRYVTFKFKSELIIKTRRFCADPIEKGLISESRLRLEAWDLLGRLRGLA
jgi:hypothetical protein